MTGSTSNLSSKLIDFIRFPLAVLVVFLHATLPLEDYDYFSIGWSTINGSDIYTIAYLSIGYIITRIAVPSFFLVSGYLFFTKLSKWDWHTYSTKIKRRCKSLVLPYFVWISVFIVYTVINKYVHSYSWTDVANWWNSHNGILMFWSSTIKDAGVNSLGNTIYNSYPALYPMWFIRDLIVLVIVSPIFYLFLSRRGLRIAFITLLLVACITRLPSHVLGINIESIFWFSVGGFLQLQKYELPTLSTKKVGIFSVTTFILFLLTLLEGSSLTQSGVVLLNVFIIVTVGSLMCLSTKIITKHCQFTDSVINLKSTTFFIFASHPFFLPYVQYFIRKIVSIVDSTPFTLTARYAEEHLWGGTDGLSIVSTYYSHTLHYISSSIKEVYSKCI